MSNGTARRYHGRDMMLRSTLSWLRGYCEGVGEEIVAKLDVALEREQTMRDDLYDLRYAAEWMRDCRGVDGLEDQFEEALNLLEEAVGRVPA